MDEFQKLKSARGTALATWIAQRDCTMLQMGERLMLIPEPATGFSSFIRLRRGNGQEVYVETKSIVRDPACGSIELDRPG